MSHDDRDQAGANARSVLVSSLVLRGKRGRGVPRHQAKVAISVQRDQDQKDGKMEVTMEPKTASRQSLLQAKTAFVRIACTSCPLSNCLPLLAPFLLNIWEEDQGLYK